MLCLAALATAAPASAQDRRAPDLIPYEVAIAGVEGELAELLRGLSTLLATRQTPPRSFGALRSRVDQDLVAFARALRSEGHYDGRIDEQIDSSHMPVAVALRVFPGPRYRIAAVQIAWEGVAPPPAAADAIVAALPLAEGAPVRAADIVAAEDVLLALLPQSGHPLARRLDRRVTIDHERRVAVVVYRVDAGPEIRFGAARFEGTEGVDTDDLARLVPWVPGDLYDVRMVERFRRTLIATRLFGGVRIGFARPEEDLRRDSGPLEPDIVLDLTMSKLRTIAIGGGFATNEGIGGDISWEHRNLLGARERLRLVLTGAEIRQAMTGAFRKPDFRRLGQTLTLDAGLERQDTDAFDSLEITGGAGLERRIGRWWTFGIAGELAFTEVDDTEGSRTFLLAALPVSVTRDSRDDLLDPTRGSYIRYAFTPHLAEQNDVFGFYRNRVEASTYVAPGDSDRLVLAGRLTVGSIVGTSRDRMPASRRFFAGGGGSVRGFGFQDIGPRDDNLDPLGGRSLFEASFEARFRVAGNFGLVPFVEVGEVTAKSLPQFSDLRWGAGLGLRYFTAFAPLRLDVAFPVNKRAGDDDVQFYISIGQSF